MAHTLFHHLGVAFSSVTKGIASVLVWLLVGVTGLFFFSQFPSPVNLLLGGPLFLLGLPMSLQALHGIIFGLISPRWGREHCPFCQSPQKVEEILSPHNGFSN